jgi:hypothetical protein
MFNFQFSIIRPKKGRHRVLRKIFLLILNTQCSILNYKTLKAEQPRQWSPTLSVVADKNHHVMILSRNGSHNLNDLDMCDHGLSRTCGNRPGMRSMLATPAVVADPVGGR